LKFEPNFVEITSSTNPIIVQNNSNSIVPKKYLDTIFVLKSRITENLQFVCLLNGSSLYFEKNEIAIVQPFDITLLFFRIETTKTQTLEVLTDISNGLLVYSTNIL
jgi:hypothetical protein